MEAVAWTGIALLAATLASSFFYLGQRIDALGADLGARIDVLGARIDAQSARIDGLTARMDQHIDRHAG